MVARLCPHLDKAKVCLLSHTYSLKELFTSTSFFTWLWLVHAASVVMNVGDVVVVVVGVVLVVYVNIMVVITLAKRTRISRY